MTKRKNILVLGGAGFMGSHLCERLLQEDNNVICIDNFLTSGENNINHLLRLPNFKFIKYDLNQPLNLEEIKDLEYFQINIFGISEIYNLACPTSVKNFDKLKLETAKANSQVLINILELAVKYKAKFMQFSSSVIYGRVSKEEYISEDYRGVLDNFDLHAVYDCGKFYAETIVETYRQKHNLDTKIVRIFRTFGPKMLIDDGQMIPDFIVNALENKDLVIHGDETFSTSLCYISDIIEGSLAVMKSDTNEPINLGNQQTYKLVEIAEQIIKLTASNSKVVFKEKINFMRELALPDISRAKELIGWFPIIELENGLKKTIDFTRANKDLLTFSKDI